MSIASAVTDVPKAIIRPLMNPKTLLIGAGITAGSLFVLSAILPGIGQWVGLRTMPLLPKLHPSLGVWPFVPGPMSGGGSSAGSRQEAAGNAIVAASQGDVNSAAGYINALLQVT
jgi:hypothetical protein